MPRPRDSGPVAARALALLGQLSTTERTGPEELAQAQRRQLAALLRHAWDTVPFYRDRIAGAGLAPPRSARGLRPRWPDWEHWRQLPMLTRRDLQGGFEALKVTRYPREHGRVWMARSSGSTGQSVAVLKTDLQRLYWRVFTLRDHLWHGRDLGGRLAAVRYVPNGRADPPDGLKSERWDTLLGDIVRTGPAALLQVHAPVEAQADWLRRTAPDYLVTYPSNLRALAEHFLAEGLELPSLRGVSTLAEKLPPEVRDLCRQAWGVEVADIYSTVECGYLALQCSETTHYHVQAEGVLLEVVDDRGEPCRPGEIGRVLVTPLHAFAMPLLRYDVGDFAEVGGPCPCGRGLPVLRRIVGRERNLLRLPDGRRVWPVFGISSLAQAAPIRQAQLVQHATDRVELCYAPARPLTPGEEDAVRRVLREHLGDAFRVQLTALAELPRSPRGKFEDFLCLVPDQTGGDPERQGGTAPPAEPRARVPSPRDGQR
jgi:phenylacetate-CoA ligase